MLNLVTDLEPVILHKFGHLLRRLRVILVEVDPLLVIRRLQDTFVTEESARRFAN